MLAAPLIRITIYEDNALLREALSVLVQVTDGYELRGAFGDCLAVEAQTAELQPDVVLMDIDLPGMSGIEATLRLHRQFPAVDVLILTVFDDDGQVFDAIRAGATGYLLKRTPPGRILDAIREVYEGGAPMSPAIARRVMQSLHPTSSMRELEQLSSRELDVLKLLAQGRSYKLVAAELGIGLETVRTYIRRIYEKLHVHSVTEAIARYRA
ncbi:MAG: response regulator transcription factor [Spirosoma sp.]|nr:response regulator transcription factor [Spirosoma sp.]